MKSTKIVLVLSMFLAMLVSSLPLQGGEAKSANIGLARWKSFEGRVTQYRELLVGASRHDKATQQEVAEFVEKDLDREMASLEAFFSGRMMLLVTETTKQEPGLRESEMGGRIRGEVDEIRQTLLGFHSALRGKSTLQERLDVVIKDAKAFEAIFSAKPFPE
jgi:hypothetical protein